MGKTDWTLLRELKNLDKSGYDYAVLILNQPILCEPEVIQRLWKNAAVRVLVDGGSDRWLQFLNSYELTNLELPDFISGDFDSISPKTRAHFESQKVNMICTPDQNETDFTKALRCARTVFDEKNLNIKMVIAICENCGRFDQSMANINTLHRSNGVLGDIPLILLSRESVTWVLRPGDHRIVVEEDFVKKQYCCGLVPFGGPTRITTKGLKWDLENGTMEMGGLVSTSNTYAASEIRITCDQHLVWTTQYCEVNQ